MPFILVDLDGSLSNDAHRRQFSDERDWDQYHSLLHLDPINWFVRDLINDFAARYKFAQVVLLTGRSEHVRVATENWLALKDTRYHALIMRHESEMALRNSEFKLLAFERYLADTGQSNVDCMLAIEDMPVVVKIWKSLGIPVLQVHQKEIQL